MTALHIYELDNNAKQQSKRLLLKNLSNYLGKNITSQDILYNENGKPTVQNLHFSVSHSKNKLVQVFTHSEPIGIDVEYINPKRKYLALANRYFHQSEYQWLNSLDPKQSSTMFYNLWSRKEAICKALGGRLWYYLRDNYIDKNQQMTTSIKGLNLTQLNCIANFSLVIASADLDITNDSIDIIHE